MVDKIIQLLSFLGIIGGIVLSAAIGVKIHRRARDHSKWTGKNLDDLALRLKIALQANDIKRAFTINHEIDQVLIEMVKGKGIIKIKGKIHATEVNCGGLTDELLLKARMEAIDLVNGTKQAMMAQEIGMAASMVNKAIVLLVKIRDIGGITADLEKSITPELERLRALQFLQEQRCRDELTELAAKPLNDKDASMARLNSIRDRAVNAGLINDHFEKF
jgi:hypothetical protein